MIVIVYMKADSVDFADLELLGIGGGCEWPIFLDGPGLLLNEEHALKVLDELGYVYEFADVAGKLGLKFTQHVSDFAWVLRSFDHVENVEAASSGYIYFKFRGWASELKITNSGSDYSYTVSTLHPKILEELMKKVSDQIIPFEYTIRRHH